MIKANQNGTFLSSGGKIAFENFDAYPYKNQGEIPSNLMIVNLCKKVSTTTIKNVCICRNCEVVKIGKRELEKTLMRKNMIR